MRVAALYDIHGNLPALDAVLADVAQIGVDRVVVGGDVLPGPMPQATLRRLRRLDLPVSFIHGNGELAVLACLGPDPADGSYTGTTSGEPLPEPVKDLLRWTASQLDGEDESLLRSWPKTLSLEVDGLGEVLFCHGTPRSEIEAFTRLTTEHLLLPLFEPLTASLVVCGHTHMQFDRLIGSKRVVNAGSVGMPFGKTGADWVLLGPDVQFRHTSYDLHRAARLVRESVYPQASEFATSSILEPPSESAMLQLFTNASFS